jgi:hypothetical protein
MSLLAEHRAYVDSVNKKAADIQRLNFWLKRQEFNSIYDVFCCSACLKCCTKCCTLRAKTGHKWHIFCAALKSKLLILFKKLVDTAGIGHPGQPIHLHAYWRFGLQTARRRCSLYALRPAPVPDAEPVPVQFQHNKTKSPPQG